MVECYEKEDQETITELRRRLTEAEESLQAIRRGEVDAFVVNTPDGDRIYTLQGTDTIYRKILEEMAEGAITLGADSSILYCNASFAKMVSRQIETVMGSNFYDYVSPHNFESVNSLVSEAAKGNGGTMGEFRLLSSSGKETPVQASASSTLVGEPNTTYLVVTDLTEKEALIRREFQNERFSAIGKVAAMMAHDLRGPLNVVHQATELIETNPGDAPKMLRIIKDSTTRALAMLSDLRENTRELELAKIDTDVDKLLRKTMQEMLLPENITTMIDSPGPTIIKIDPDRMRRVFSNLINNAVDAMPDGGTLSVTIRNQPGSVGIRVTDTGTGIADNITDRLFELFVSTKSKGTGLGLPLCKRVVDSHGGGITFETEKGKGTSFTITLPQTG